MSPTHVADDARLFLALHGRALDYPFTAYATGRSLAVHAAASLARLRDDTAAGGDQFVVGPGRSLDEVIIGIRLGAVASVRPPVIALHAAAVDLRDRVVVLPAPAGSGKSSLAVAMAMSGWRYLGDEVVGVRTDSLAVCPCPTPARITPAVAHALGVSTSTPGSTDGKVLALAPKQKHLGPARPDVKAPTHIVVPRYIPGAPTRLRSLEIRYAAAEIAQSVFPSSVAGQDLLDVVARLALTTDAYGLTFGDARSAAVALKGL